MKFNKFIKNKKSDVLSKHLKTMHLISHKPRSRKSITIWNISKLLHTKLIVNGLLLDKNNIIKGLKIFRNNYKDFDNLDEFIEMIKKDYLLSPV